MKLLSAYGGRSFQFRSTAILATLLTWICAGPSAAQEQTQECRAVSNLASIRLSKKLILGLSQDTNEKRCDFVVSLPPPHTISTSMNAWYTLSASAISDEKFAADLVAKIAVATIPKIFERYNKDIINQIFRNAKSVSVCIASMLNKKEVSLKSKDGEFQCKVAADADYAEFQVVVGPFTNTLLLPRPI